MRRDRGFDRMVMRLAALALTGAYELSAHAQQVLTPPNLPLSFGMNPDEASQALGVPLNYLRGRPGNELFVVIPNVRGSALSRRSDGLYLQFRNGRLTGWKGDWGTIRP